MGAPLNETEHLVLLALARLGDEAYGVPVRQEIERRSGTPISIAAVYSALGRLESRGFTRTWLSEPTSRRGGRARKHYAVTTEGLRELAKARAALERMWDGLDLPAGAHGGGPADG